MTPVGGTIYEGTLPSGECGDVISYYFSAGYTHSVTAGPVTNNHEGTLYSPYGAPGVSVNTVALANGNTLTSEAFEGAAPGWTVENTNVASGGFQILDPKATTINAKDMSPENDASPVGTKAFMTSAGGTGADNNDLDGGPSTLLSPVFDLSAGDAVVSYSRYFRDQFNGTTGGGDQFVISVTNDGRNWVPVETVTFAPAGWLKRTFRVGQYVTPSATVQIRFVASDNPNNSITIAGVDDFSINAIECSTPCAGDLDGTGEVDGADLGLLLGAWDTNDPAADLDASGLVDGADLGLLLGAWVPAPDR